MKVILIGGSSHVGKSTIATSLAAKLGWIHVSTDSLARHPGRPWRSAPDKVPEDVAEHYLCLTVDELIEDVLRHYRLNVWPKVEAIIASHSDNTSPKGVVLEGSALWPEFSKSLDFTKTAAIWLTASDEFFRQRIHSNSQYTSKSIHEKMMIDKFLERTIVYNARMIEVVNRHGLTLLDVQRSNAIEIVESVLETLGFDKP